MKKTNTKITARIKFLILAAVSLVINLLFCPSASAAAGNYSISVSKASVTTGTAVTLSVTMTNASVWAISSINASGAGFVCSASINDSGFQSNSGVTATASRTCTPKSAGTLTFTVSGEFTDNDGTTKAITGSKTVTVTAPAPQPQPQPQPTPTPAQTTKPEQDDEDEEAKKEDEEKKKAEEEAKKKEEEEKKKEEALKEEQKKDEKTQEGIGNILERDGPDWKQILIFVFAGIAAVTLIALIIVIVKLIKCKKSQKAPVSIAEPDDDFDAEDDANTNSSPEDHVDPYADDKRPLGSPDENSEH